LARHLEAVEIRDSSRDLAGPIAVLAFVSPGGYHKFGITAEAHHEIVIIWVSYPQCHLAVAGNIAANHEAM
jgi:hypothetical protein